MTQKNRPTAAKGSRSDAREGSGREVEQTEVRVSSRRQAPPSTLELMLARAQAVLAGMTPADPRARLLRVAMLRRDEILLEALLRRLDVPLP